MFNEDFYPTPDDVLNHLLKNVDVKNKIVLEPSAGKGNIVNFLHYKRSAKSILVCENEPDLQAILKQNQHCRFLSDDFLNVTEDMVSHINLIIMNPPFSCDDKHILHAWSILPDGAELYAICNANTILNPFSVSRKILVKLIKDYGGFSNKGPLFINSERPTNVDIGFVKLIKPKKEGVNYEEEFDDFFLEPDDEEKQENGLMSYNFVRDMVNRYVAAVKLFDQQLELGIQMNMLTQGFFSSSLSFNVTQDKKTVTRDDFKKDLQKSGWKFIFEKMNLQKYSTTSLRNDINKFVEEQTHIPFTMKNIYKMLEIVIKTTDQRFDKAIIEVFDKLTKHTDENRYCVPGWKTNSHYLINRKIIIPYICPQDRWSKGNRIDFGYGRYEELLEDFIKSICYVSGDNWNLYGSIRTWTNYRWKVIAEDKVSYFSDDVHYNGYMHYIDNLTKEGKSYKLIDQQCSYGEEFEWAFFKIRCFKKGTMHVTFKDEEIWGRFNQRIAKIMGYPLFEAKTKK